MTVMLLGVTVVVFSIKEKKAREKVWKKKWPQSGDCVDKGDSVAWLAAECPTSSF